MQLCSLQCMCLVTTWHIRILHAMCPDMHKASPILQSCKLFHSPLSCSSQTFTLDAFYVWANLAHCDSWLGGLYFVHAAQGYFLGWFWISCQYGQSLHTNLPLPPPLEGAEFPSPTKRYKQSRERVIVYDFDVEAIRHTIHGFMVRRSSVH